MVWQKPLSRLAAEFGISGGGLASTCKRLDVPYPPPGYWAKKEAGKPVVTLDLGPTKDGMPETVEIHPDAPRPVALPGGRTGCGSYHRACRYPRDPREPG